VIRKVIIGTASVIALSVAEEIASSALDYAADANTATAASMPAPAQTSNDALTGDAFRRDDIRWARWNFAITGFIGDRSTAFWAPRPDAP
jgi:hypothetical protein